MIRLLGISGSLRAGSSNTALLLAAGQVAPADMAIVVYQGLDGLPAFNPDLDQEGQAPPEGVAALRRQVAASSGLLISSPEYAHGVPGSLKNALDWLVSSPVMLDKAVGLFSSGRALAQLSEILATLSARVPPQARLDCGGLRGKIDAQGKILNSQLRLDISAALLAMERAIHG
jgi:chromate reductase